MTAKTCSRCATEKPSAKFARFGKICYDCKIKARESADKRRSARTKASIIYVPVSQSVWMEEEMHL